MAHKLVTIAVIGLSASAVCMGAAAAIGGPSFADDFDGIFDQRPRCQKLADATETSRELEWHGGDRATLAMPAQASYSPHNSDRLLVTGDPQIVSHVRVKDGDIELDCRGWNDRARGLVVALPGREFRAFDIAGSGNLVLDKLDQSRLEIEIAGSGSVKANGKVDNLKIEVAGSGKADLDQIIARETRIEIAGSGNVRANGRIDDLTMEISGSGDADFSEITGHRARVEISGSGTVKAKGNVEDLDIEIEGSGRADFGQVTSRTAKVEIGGHGNVDIAPSEEARAEISGSGDVNLHSNPKRLETDISGSGRIHRLASGS
jgi:hypothetical protein